MKITAIKIVQAMVFGTAGLAAAAQAESSVTLYGLIDLGYMYDYDESKGSAQSINSGNESGSRWGLKGEEDLGNGLKAIFQLESGFDADTGMAAQSGRLFGRWAYVGLASNTLGEIRLGRQWVLGREWGGVATPFSIAWSRSGLGTTFGYNDGDFGASGIADNMVMWRSPKVSGFEAAVGYSFAINGDEEFGTGNNDRMVTAGVRYGRGPLRAALTYEHSYADQRRSARNASNWQLGASYDFEVVRIYAGAGRISDANKGPARNVDKDVAWTAGVRVPVGPGALLASWQQTTNSKIKGYAVGYQYDLSKRTDLYVFYNHSETRNLNTSEDNERRQASVGIRHRF
ncbi:porin [Bordetella muralis]|uniref:porin n=1 Tax=Bordetella muralis TaxID=1649130 RepID=UPI0039EDEF21